MKKLYGSINKIIQYNNKKINEIVNYYKLEDDKYGLEIEKKNENKKIESINKIDITEDEEKIDYLLKMLVNKQVLPSSDGVVEDMITQYI